MAYRDAYDMIRNVEEDEMGTQIVRTLGGDQQMRVINESGLYSAILKSRKPEAKRFKKWVTTEVLPSIRKTGSYNADPMAALQDPETLRRLLLGSNDTVIAQRAIIEKQQVSVDALDRIANAEGTLTLTETAKTQQQKPQKFIQRCATAKVIYRRPGQKAWFAYQHWIDRGYLVHKVTTIDSGSGDEK